MLHKGTWLSPDAIHLSAVVHVQGQCVSKLAVFEVELDPASCFHGIVPSGATAICLGMPARNVGHKELNRVLGHIGNVFQRYLTWGMRTPDAILESPCLRWSKYFLDWISLPLPFESSLLLKQCTLYIPRN